VGLTISSNQVAVHSRTGWHSECCMTVQKKSLRVRPSACMHEHAAPLGCMRAQGLKMQCSPSWLMQPLAHPQKHLHDDGPCIRRCASWTRACAHTHKHLHAQAHPPATQYISSARSAAPMLFARSLPDVTAICSMAAALKGGGTPIRWAFRLRCAMMSMYLQGRSGTGTISWASLLSLYQATWPLTQIYPALRAAQALIAPFVEVSKADTLRARACAVATPTVCLGGVVL